MTSTLELLAPIVAEGDVHGAICWELGQRVHNRNFNLHVHIEPQGQVDEGIDYDYVAEAVESWLISLDPDQRSPDPSLTLSSGPVQIALRAHGKPQLLRGSGRLVANRI